MQDEAMLTQLGYAPNEALVKQLKKIQQNTVGYDKIQKHIMDLNDHLKIDNAYVALSNSKNYFKIKVEPSTPELDQEAHEKIKHFSDKFKIELEKLPKKETYYIVGFHNN
jgi:mRNA-degrading endonuclease RelE of RelBE toxin-antitoxin system